MSDIIVHPEFKRLKNHLSNLIIEFEALKFDICPDIERKYILNFGFLEFELYKKDVELNKLRRKIQLIQIKINNQEPIGIEKIDNQIEKEFEEYEKNIKKQMDELDNAIKAPDFEYLSEKETKRLKMIYKQCVLKLHPDLNKNLSESDKNLFLQINKAFKKGDLNTIESLYYLINTDEIEPISDIDRLKELIDDLEDKIKEIKENYPYNKKPLLSSKKRIYEYKLELNSLIEQFDSEIQLYLEKMEKLI